MSLFGARISSPPAPAPAQAHPATPQRLANGEVLTAQEEQAIYKGKLEATAGYLDGPLKESIDGHISDLDKIPASKVTEIMAELDVSRAEATYIEWSNRPRVLRIDSYFVPPKIDDRYRASGGPVAAGVPYTVGEQGRELFVPGVDGTIINHTQTTALFAQGASAAPVAHTAAPNVSTGLTAAHSGITLSLMDRWQVEAVVSQRDADLLMSLEAGLR